MSVFKRIFTHWKVLLLLVLLFFSYITINGGLTPHFWDEGTAIRSVAPESAGALAGIANPSPDIRPVDRERIISFNGQPVRSVEDYYALEAGLTANQSVQLETNLNFYRLTIAKGDLGLRVYDAPTSNIKKGLDLEGGTRVLLKPTEIVSKDIIEVTASSLRERLNVYGLSDVVVRSASDLGGNNFILVEIAGVTEGEVRELLAKQGKFEAKIGNETVFFGGKKDVTYVCMTADCSGIDPNLGCVAGGEGQVCRFFFTITMNQEAAERQAAITKNLAVVTEEGQSYLSEDLRLFLDDVEVDTLKIGAELKGRASTNIQISGSGTGRTQQEAMTATLQNMDKLRTVIITGSLPVSLDIVKFDTISPSLGKEFLHNVFLVGFLALIAVSAVIAIRYRKWKVILPVMLTLISELILILGFAALAGINLDLAAIAGIIITIGTGVNHLIIIADETLSGRVANLDWKSKIKNAMSVVLGSYFVNLSGIIPLWFLGAGLLKGFAITTFVGASFGVLIARPAFAAIIEILIRE